MWVSGNSYITLHYFFCKFPNNFCRDFRLQVIPVKIMCILRAYPVWHTGFSYTLYGGNICSVSAKCQLSTVYILCKRKIWQKVDRKKRTSFWIIRCLWVYSIQMRYNISTLWYHKKIKTVKAYTKSSNLVSYQLYFSTPTISKKYTWLP